MNRRVQMNRPKLESSFIANTKDFDFILKQVAKNTAQSKPFYRKGWFIITVASFTGIIFLTKIL